MRQAILDANPNDPIVFDIPTSDPGYYAPTGVYTISLTSADSSIEKNLGISAFGSHVVVRRNTSSEFPDLYRSCRCGRFDRLPNDLKWIR